MQDAVFPTSDSRSKRSVAAQEQNFSAAARKPVTRPVTAQVSAKKKQTVQDAVCLDERFIYGLLRHIIFTQNPSNNWGGHLTLQQGIPQNQSVTLYGVI